MTGKGKYCVSTAAVAGIFFLTAFLGFVITYADGSETRAAGEDIRIDIKVDFVGINEMTGDVTIEVNKIIINSTLMTSDEIRSS